MGIALDTDGKRGYIPVSKRAGDVISTGSDRVDVIDIASNSVIAEIPIAGIDNKGPTDVAVKPDGSRVHVTHRGDNRVIVIDTSSHTVVKSIDLGAGGAEGTSGIAVTPDGSRVYTADRESRTVSVVDTDTNSLVATIPVDIGPSGSKTFIAISPDGNRAYTTFRDADIAVVDTDPTSPTFHSQIGILHSSGESLNGIAMVPTGSLTYIADGVADGKLLILDTNPASPDFHRELGFVTVGDTPVDVVVQNPQIAQAYVKNEGDEVIAVVGFPFCTLELALERVGNSIEMNFELGIKESGRWDIWASTRNDTVLLRSQFIQRTHPPVSRKITIHDAPKVGVIGVLTTLTSTTEGAACRDFATVYTGRPASESVP